jgi:hypothetical protein
MIGKDILEKLAAAAGRIILKLLLKKISCEVAEWIYLAHDSITEGFLIVRYPDTCENRDSVSDYQYSLEWFSSLVIALFHRSL